MTDKAKKANVDGTDDEVFRSEQEHLSATYRTLQGLAHTLIERLEEVRREAAKDKEEMSEDAATNFATWDDAMETYADIASMNRIIDAYNREVATGTEELENIALLMKQPYFAKVVLQFKEGEAPKELYIGTAGVADANYRRIVVDWRSPVAEVYYNQDNGPTSYRANGRTIKTDLKLRRQFDIEADRLNAYFDTTVAIQDSLLLASLSQTRSDKMKAITSTIQKEQNTVIRHDDVPVLLVSGIAGSGKTSVLLQRIAFLFYRNRETLRPEEVFLISPNPVFSHYIEGVLPDLGERNPECLTWTQFAHTLLPEGVGTGDGDVAAAALAHIDEATAHFEFEPADFRDLTVDGTRLISATQIQRLSEKYANLPAGPHRIAVMSEDMLERLESRFKQMSTTEKAQDELVALSLDEQLRLFRQAIAPQSDEELRELTLRYIRDRYADAERMVENIEWLNIDRMGMRLLDHPGLTPVEWLYLKIALTGMGNPYAKYVMIDEVQDYTYAQLAVMARYFRRAHFLLLGDPNQAIAEKTASWDEIRRLFTVEHGEVSECRLTTSYRSTPQITELFARLLSPEERLEVSSIRRDETAPKIIVCATEERRLEAIRSAVTEAQGSDGLTAVIVPWKQDAKRLTEQLNLSEDAVEVMTDNGTLPAEGVVVLPLKLAKGLEFDHVIIPDASVRVFGDDALSRRRLYTAISRATGRITLIAPNALSPLLD